MVLYPYHSNYLYFTILLCYYCNSVASVILQL